MTILDDEYFQTMVAFGFRGEIIKLSWYLQLLRVYSNIFKMTLNI